MPTAIVTGANGGVGQEVTRLLLQRGWEVLAQFHTEPVSELVDAVWWKADFTSNSPDFDHLPHRTRIHALVHCAGTVVRTRCDESFVDDWKSSIDVHLTAPVQLTNHCLEAMRATGGHVIYINSVSAKNPVPTFAPYCASKAAARAWMDCLREEEPDLKVSTIFADKIDTPARRELLAQDGILYEPSDYLTPQTAAMAVLRVLTAQPDLMATELTIRPAQR